MRFKRTAAVVGTGLLIGGFGAAADAAGSLSKNVIDPAGTVAQRTITVNFSEQPPSTQIFVNQCWVNGNAPGAVFNPNNDCSPQGAVFTPSLQGSGSIAFVAWGGIDPNLEEWGCGFTTPAGIPKADTCFIRITPDTKANVSADEFFPITFAAGQDPVVPEVPLNILLPLSAAAVLGGSFFIVRKRKLSEAA